MSLNPVFAKGNQYVVSVYKKDFVDLIAVVAGQLHLVHLRQNLNLGPVEGTLWLSQSDLLVFGKNGLQTIKID